MKDLVAKLRQKPEHVRQRIAVGASAGVTAVIAVTWAGTMAATGTFAIAPSGNGSPAAQPDSFALSGTNAESNFSQLMGAVGAAAGATSSEPALTIIDGETTSSFDTAPATNPSATVIPF